jgi:hypothetical protein
MLKDTTFKEKFAMIKEWMPSIVESIKKDLRTEHLKKDWLFTKTYFPHANVNKLSSEELAEGYSRAMNETDKSEELGEFICNRWLLKNTEIYSFFEAELLKISPDFTELTEIPKDKSMGIVNNASKQFGAPKTYLFSILNSVVFPKEVYDHLKKLAQSEKIEEEKSEKIALEQQSVDAMRNAYEQNLARLTDKYEKKLSGLQKKYLQDTESLKKQIAQLQRKLNG